MTDEQRERVRALIDEIKAICAVALSQPPISDRERHDNIDAPWDRHASPTVSADIAVAPEADLTAQEAPSRPVTRQVDPQRYAEVGLFVERGLVTHALGDEYADAVLEGQIPFEEARARQEAFEQKVRRMPHGGI